jgi:hypothetical protein
MCYPLIIVNAFSLVEKEQCSFVWHRIGMDENVFMEKLNYCNNLRSPNLFCSRDRETNNDYLGRKM